MKAIPIIGYPAHFRIRSKKHARELVENILLPGTEIEFVDIESMNSETGMYTKYYIVAKDEDGRPSFGHGQFTDTSANELLAAAVLMDDDDVIRKVFAERKSFNAHMRKKGL